MPRLKVTLSRFIFVAIVLIVVFVLLYFHLIEIGYNHPFYFIILFFLGLCLLIWIFWITAPNNLYNKDYRYSKKGRKEWDKKIKSTIEDEKNNFNKKDS